MQQLGAAETFGVAVAVISERLCVVYERSSGEIVHTHRVVTLEGGHEPSDDEMAAYAVSLASRRRGSTERLETLHVASDALQPGRRYRIEHEHKRLVDAANR